MKKKIKTPTRKPAKGRKRTSDRVSRLAAKVLRVMSVAPVPDGYLLTFTSPNSVKPHEVRRCVSAADIRALAASCLSQDEVKGPRGRKVKR